MSILISFLKSFNCFRVDKAVKILVVFFSFVFGYFQYLMSKESIFRPFRTRKYEINHIRSVNHIHLLEECINNNEKEKSEKFNNINIINTFWSMSITANSGGITQFIHYKIINT